MAIKISSFKASVKNFAKKIAKAYTTKPQGKIRSGSGGAKCTAMCILVSEDGFKEPVCLDHPTKEMEMDRLMKGEVERVWIAAYKAKGGLGGGLRGGCLYEYGDENSEDGWSEKTLCEGFDECASLSFDVESLEEEWHMEEMKRTGALYLAFENVDDENDNDWMEIKQKMKSKLVNRVEKWLSKVESSDATCEWEMDKSGSSDDRASTLIKVSGLVSHPFEKIAAETTEWMKKNEVVEKEEGAGSLWDVAPQEEFKDYSECKKTKELTIKVCA